MGTFHQHKFRHCSFDYFSMIRSNDIKEWYPLILVCDPTKFGGCCILETFATKFLHVTWLHDYITWHERTVIFHSDMTYLICHVITWSNEYYRVVEYCFIVPTKSVKYLLKIIFNLLKSHSFFHILLSTEMVSPSTINIFFSFLISLSVKDGFTIFQNLLLLVNLFWSSFFIEPI